MVQGKREATAILKIRGMSDSVQARRFRRTATRLDGVLRVDVDYILDSVTVKYDADKLTPAQIKKRLGLRQPAPVIHGSDSGRIRRQDEHVTTAK
ncbi:MAG: cation transporter [Nitrososphaerota archaeon]|nr:cation transporter [Nitrososphaerota archaeon]MDG7027442.1 cation transporter [Nitrososphaerota archaeon]